MFRARGLTLVELLIIVIVLGLLAAIVTPQFSRAEDDSRMVNLKSNLLDIRAQVRLYRTQHGDRYPDLDRFVEQMTSYSNAQGKTSRDHTGDCTFGPYLQNMPANPYTGGNKVGNGAVGTSDWYYDQTTGLFRANNHPDLVSQ